MIFELIWSLVDQSPSGSWIYPCPWVLEQDFGDLKAFLTPTRYGIGRDALICMPFLHLYLQIITVWMSIPVKHLFYDCWIWNHFLLNNIASRGRQCPSCMKLSTNISRRWSGLMEMRDRTHTGTAQDSLHGCTMIGIQIRLFKDVP